MPLLLSNKNDQGFVGPVDINWSNPQTAQLFFLPWFNGGAPVDLVTRRYPTTVSGTIGIGEHLGIFNTTTTGANWVEWSGSWISTLTPGSNNGWTMMVRFTQRGTTPNIQGSLMSTCVANGTSYTIIGNNAASPAFWCGNLVNSYTGLTTYTDASTYTFFVSNLMTGTATGVAFRDGVVVSNIAGKTITATAPSRIRIGQERGTAAGGAPNGGGFANIGEITMAAIWKRSLTVGDMTRIAENPYGLIKQQQPMRSEKLFFRGWGVPLNG